MSATTHQNHRYDQERRGVGHVDAKEQTRHQARQRERTDQADCRSNSTKPQPLLQHHADYGCAASAKGHPDSDLVRATGNRIGDDSINSHSGKPQSESRETAKEPRVEPGPRYRIPKDLIHCLDLGQRKLRVHFPDLVLNRRDQLFGTDSASDEQAEVAQRKLVM